MKNKFITSISVIGAMLLLLAAGTFAYQYLTFTGDEQIEQADNNVNEILDILEEVAARGDMTAEELASAKDRIKELEDMNPAGLAKQNKELRNQVAQLNTDINAKNKAYDQLQQERDQIATARDTVIAERDNLQAQYNTLNDGYTQLQTELTQANEYVEHLEAELVKANAAVANHASKVSEAVEQARSYKE